MDEKVDLVMGMFDAYLIEYEKPYRSLSSSSSLFQKRYAAFSQNVDRIASHNHQYALGLTTFTLGLNGKLHLK